MKQDRFLVGILIGIAILIVAALALFFTRQDTQTYRPENTPEGVTYNYSLAVVNKDYEKAYSYLAELENKPSYEQFRQTFFSGGANTGDVGVEVGAAEIDGQAALVELTVIHAISDPFAGRFSTDDRAQLVRQNGQWKLKSMPYNFWSYDWYQEAPKP